MLERVSGRTWEELIVERVFIPLGLKSAGLGPQSTLGRIDAPLDREALPDGTLKAMLAGPNGDNPELIGPAGTAHLRTRLRDLGSAEHGRRQARTGSSSAADAAQAAHQADRRAARAGCAGWHALERQLRIRLGQRDATFRRPTRR